VSSPEFWNGVPLPQALIHGLNRHYYSIAINYRKNELEEKMLLNLHKKKWTDGLTLQKFDGHAKSNEATVQVICHTMGGCCCFSSV
jgi:26S proteasome regulatory subunit N11